MGAAFAWYSESNRTIGCYLIKTSPTVSVTQHTLRTMHILSSDRPRYRSGDIALATSSHGRVSVDLVLQRFNLKMGCNKQERLAVLRVLHAQSGFQVNLQRNQSVAVSSMQGQWAQRRDQRGFMSLPCAGAKTRRTQSRVINRVRTAISGG